MEQQLSKIIKDGIDLYIENFEMKKPAYEPHKFSPEFENKMQQLFDKKDSKKYGAFIKWGAFTAAIVVILSVVLPFMNRFSDTPEVYNPTTTNDYSFSTISTDSTYTTTNTTSSAVGADHTFTTDNTTLAPQLIPTDSSTGSTNGTQPPTISSSQTSTQFQTTTATEKTTYATEQIYTLSAKMISQMQADFYNQFHPSVEDKITTKTSTTTTVHFPTASRTVAQGYTTSTTNGLVNGDPKPPKFDDTANIEYIGTLNGCIICYAGWEGNDETTVYLYKNRTYKTLIEAYNSGWINSSNLKNLADLYPA